MRSEFTRDWLNLSVWPTEWFYCFALKYKHNQKWTRYQVDMIKLEWNFLIKELWKRRGGLRLIWEESLLREAPWKISLFRTALFQSSWLSKSSLPKTSLSYPRPRKSTLTGTFNSWKNIIFSRKLAYFRRMFILSMSTKTKECWEKNCSWVTFWTIQWKWPK